MMKKRIKKAISYQAVKDKLYQCLEYKVEQPAFFKIVRRDLKNDEFNTWGVLCIDYRCAENVDAEIVVVIEKLITENKYFETHFHRGVFVKRTLPSKNKNEGLIEDDYYDKIYPEEER